MKNKSNIKLATIAIEKRLRMVATWECTKGNRYKTTPEEVFECANGFRKMLECGMFRNIEEMEDTVFAHWGLDQPVGTVTLEFMDTNPIGGG